MSRLLVRSCVEGFLTLLVACPLWGQSAGSSGSIHPPGGSAPGQPVGPSQPSTPSMGAPRYVGGRVLLDSGQPAPEPVSVGLHCGARSLQVISTDLKGYFQFILEAGPQTNMTLSAADKTPEAAGVNGITSPGGYGGFSNSDRGLIGCELRVSVGGYMPLAKTLSDPYPDSLGHIDVGTLFLKRVGGTKGSAISVADLLVPSGARSEFQKGVEDARSNRLKSATQHLEKAVAEYDKYAEAWNELGKIYSTDHEMDKARHAFEKAVTANPQYIPPYVALASLAIQDQEFESAVETAGKALVLDPGLGVANFLQAVGYFHLNRVDAAEKSGREAEKRPHQGIPQLHALLAEIFLQKQDYPNAAAEMRAYLKESPQGHFADDMKRDLDQIERSATNADKESNPSSPEPQIAP